MGRVVSNACNVIRVTPVITGDTYANNDVLFDSTEIKHAVLDEGGCSKLVSCIMSSKSNSLFDIELFFCSVSQSVGSANSARNVSDADWATCKVLGRLTLDSSADNYNYGAGRVHNFDRQSAAFPGGTVLNERFKSRFPIILKADSSSTSVYCFAFLTGDDVTPDFSVGDIELIIGVEY